ncbi:MAG: UDP-N-acetylglucosamine 4,6-dehydratase (inverting) [Myxococcota bacterium]|nr:UDP-N-acetylglucosamine 4,6-dehydratase (inverting) [Myxococcota bacterium]
MFDGASLLITGGTGSLGNALSKYLLENTGLRRLIIYSRDELKQHEMRQRFGADKRMRFFIGNVRDLERMRRAFNGVDYVIHAAALKQVPAAEYNPFECIKTNVLGAQNVIEAALDCGVKRLVALSTDKACNPINLYGATKLCSDKLFVAGNAYAGASQTRFAVVRYGNVSGSRGSVVPLFKHLAAEGGEVPITDARMTRFWITIENAVKLVMDSFEQMQGGEIFVPKIPSMRIIDLAEALCPGQPIRSIGIRPGEKLHEAMIGEDDARSVIDMGERYAILPEFEWYTPDMSRGTRVPEGFCYTSDANEKWLSVAELRRLAGL